MQGQLLFWVQTVSILCYGTVFFHIGVLLLVSKKQGTLRSALAHLLVTFGVMCLMGGLSLYLDLKDRLIDYLVYVPLVAIGPLADGFLFAALGVVQPHRRRFAVLWAGFLGLSLVGAVLFASPVPVRYIYALGYAWLFAVLGNIVLDLAGRLEPGWFGSRPLRLFFLTIIVNLILVASMGGVQLWGAIDWMFPLWILTIFSMFGLLVLVGLKPELLETLAQVADQRMKYVKSRWETGAEAACQRLEEHMRVHSPHFRPDLKIAELANELGLSPEQLSELINSRFGCNFNQYINQYRVQSACQALRERSDLTVLDVCFASGFNSKSAFNQAFKAVTGMTPREYRTLATEGPRLRSVRTLTDA